MFKNIITRLKIYFDKSLTNEFLAITNNLMDMINHDTSKDTLNEISDTVTLLKYTFEKYDNDLRKYARFELDTDLMLMQIDFYRDCLKSIDSKLSTKFLMYERIYQLKESDKNDCN